MEGYDRLSNKQLEVLFWVCEGKRDREIATILGISYRTVTVHVGAILSKLEVENRTSAAMLVIQSGRLKDLQKRFSEGVQLCVIGLVTTFFLFGPM